MRPSSKFNQVNHLRLGKVVKTPHTWNSSFFKVRIRLVDNVLERVKDLLRLYTKRLQ
jgi:hypothetical protein